MNNEIISILCWVTKPAVYITDSHLTNYVELIWSQINYVGIGLIINIDSLSINFLCD